MASSSQNVFENLIGKEQANNKNDGAGSSTMMEQPPFNIFLVKKSPKKTLGHELDSTQDGLSFKLPKSGLQDLFAMVEVGEVARIPLRETENTISTFTTRSRRGDFCHSSKLRPFIIHAHVPKAIKPKERNMPLEPLASESSNRKRKAHEVREITEEERKFVDKFLEEAWNNISRQRDEDEEQVMMQEILRSEWAKRPKIRMVMMK